MAESYLVDPDATYYYCYCLVAGDASISLKDAGTIPGGYPPEDRLIGGLRAIVSRVEREDYSAESLRGKLEQIGWVSAAALGHEQVIEGCLRQTEVIPLKFCTVFRSESALDAAFLVAQDELTSKLQYLRGKQEWGLRFTADQCSLKQHLKETDSRFQGLLDGFDSKPAGAAYFLRKRLQEQLERAADQSRCDVAGLAFSRLTALATESALVGGAMAGTDRGDPVVNAAFLVTEEQLIQLLEEAMRLLSDYPWLICDRSGPWPPYNFV